MNVLGIDPGLTATGVAAVTNGRWYTSTVRSTKRGLVDKALEIRAEISHALSGLPDGTTWDVFVVEMPQIYQRHKAKGDPNGLIRLAVLVGALLSVVQAKQTLLPRPSQWKGAVPKSVHHQRIRAALPGLGRCSSDAMDAIGLCLYGSRYANTEKR